MKFRIECDLKNYETALDIIATAGAQYFDEAIELVKKHRLFKQALKCYDYDSELSSKVKRAFGDYLMERGYL